MVSTIIERQRHFFNSNQTKSYSFRIHALQTLKRLIQSNEQAFYDAIYEDFQKSSFETYSTELALLYHDIELTCKKLKRWMKPTKVRSDLANFPSSQTIMPEPYGVSLIIGTWNYPYGLTLTPLVGAIAAGNCAIIKPSEIAQNASKLMTRLLNTHFNASFIHVIEGGKEVTRELLEHKFDKIFFTGSTHVGKIVYQAAAKHLTPVTLELGGKSPTFVLSTKRLALIAKRIVWAKFINAGQTCIAPDYIVVPRAIHDTVVKAIEHEIAQRFTNVTSTHEHYTQIINEAHFTRLTALTSHPIQTDPQTRFISPTVLPNASFDDAVMQDEIFGPLLPIVPYDNFEKLIQTLQTKPKPLACYIYGGSKTETDYITTSISSGAVVINDSVMHITNSALPFGGVGESGLGNYHGVHSFKAFSHYKSILHKPLWVELPLKYAPYKGWKRWVIQKIFE